MNDLSGSAVEGGEGGPEHLVAVNDALERHPHDRDIQVALQAQGERHQVGSRARAFQLVQEPEPLLGEGEGEGTGPIQDRDWQFIAGCNCSGEVGCQIGQDRGEEDLAERQFPMEFHPQAGDHLGGEEGMAAEVEEVVVDADPVNLQHLGKNLGEGSFGGGAGGDVGVDGGLVVGGGEGLAVELAVGGEGQGGEADEGGRGPCSRAGTGGGRRAGRWDPGVRPGRLGPGRRSDGDRRGCLPGPAPPPPELRGNGPERPRFHPTRSGSLAA